MESACTTCDSLPSVVVAYLGSLAVLFVAAFWQLDEFSGTWEMTPPSCCTRRSTRTY